jgi:hypothetical protein
MARFYTASFSRTGDNGGTGPTGPTGPAGPTGPTGPAGTTYTTSSNVRLGSLGIGTAAPPAGDIRATGDITASYSDDRLKTRIGLIENALDKVLALNGFYYVPNELAQSLGYENTTQRVGVSAQEVEAVLPEACGRVWYW